MSLRWALKDGATQYSSHILNFELVFMEIFASYFSGMTIFTRGQGIRNKYSFNFCEYTLGDNLVNGSQAMPANSHLFSI